MSFLGEIKRRKVFQVTAVYAVVAWLLIQIVDVLNDPLNLPSWLDTVVVVLFGVGFLVAVILAWAFDLTPDGVVRTPASDVDTDFRIVLRPRTQSRGIAMKYLTLFAVTLVLASPVSGHHNSETGMDVDSVVAFEGTVTEFSWKNPHVYVFVETTDERGEQIEWALQMGASAITARRYGWTPDSLSSGDRVTVRGHPAQDGRPYAELVSIDKEGVVLPMNSEAPEVTASASTLTGVWIADRSKLISYAGGGMVGLFRALLQLTDKGKASQAQYDALSDENPESTCIGSPTPAMLVYTILYPLVIQINEDEETIVLRSEYFDRERTVYMDGRGHPENGERFLPGHSIGWWEEDTLVVDTTNFADHRSPYQAGVGSGAQKHVVERYRLTEDRTRIELEFVLEDPEYLAEPLTHSRELIYSPHMEMSRFNCDLETTRRFLSR